MEQVLMEWGLDPFLASHIMSMAHEMEHRDKMRKVVLEEMKNSTAFALIYSRMCQYVPVHLEPWANYEKDNHDPYSRYVSFEERGNICTRDGLLVQPDNLTPEELMKHYKEVGFVGRKIVDANDMEEIRDRINCPLAYDRSVQHFEPIPIADYFLPIFNMRKNIEFDWENNVVSVKSKEGTEQVDLLHDSTQKIRELLFKIPKYVKRN